MNLASVLEVGAPAPAVFLLALLVLFVLGSFGLVLFVFAASHNEEDELLAADDSW